MLRSMYSGIAGLRNFQTKLDVIGNNIANVNTHGFKKGRTIFKDVISQTVSGASAPGETRGGVNPKQIGLGSQIAAIETIHAGGSPQFTGITLDLSIEKDGYFQVQDGLAVEGEEGELFGEIFYTRAGNFSMDAAGNLVDIDGRYVVGILPDDPEIGDFPDPDPDPTVRPDFAMINIPLTATSMSIGQDGTVYYVDRVDPEDLDSEAVLLVAGKLQIAKFSNPSGLEKVGGNLYRESANSGIPLVGGPLDQGFGAVNSGFLEMSNVDLAEEFTEMIIAQRGFQANTRIITTSDEILQELVNLKR